MLPSSQEPVQRLYHFYQSVRAHFGYADPWWPGTPMEIAITAILVQQCDWTVASQAASRLRDSGLLNPHCLAGADTEEVHDKIRPVTFAPTKSKRLIAFAQGIVDRGFAEIERYLESGPTDHLRRELLKFRGVGDETADCILLFASDHHAVFVVDESTRRVFERLHLFPELDSGFWRSSYGKLSRFFRDTLRAGLTLYEGLQFTAMIPREIALLRDFHAQIVELGRHHCLKNYPRCDTSGKSGWKNYLFCQRHCQEGRCEACPLRELCQRHGVS